MRLTALTSLATLALASAAIGTALQGCSSNSVDPSEKVIRAGQPIQGGTLDQTDNNVVSILINDQGLSLCSGSLIGPNLVLSAHHCVADNTSTSCGSSDFGALYPASAFVVTTSYDAAAQAFNNNQFPAVDGVTWFGVKTVAVPGNNICGQDLSALTLSSSISGICPLIPSVDTDVSDSELYTAIGFGVTSPNGQTAGTRYKVTGMDVQCAEDCNDPTQSATEEWLGVNSGNKGTCEGDSGGPAIDSLGRVIGSVSRGPANACNQTVYESYYGEGTWIKQQGAKAATAGGYTAAGWVTGGATSNPANGYCGGSSSSSSSSSSTSSTSSSTSSSSSSSSGGMPGSCTDANGTIGCCDGNVNWYCSSTGTLTSTTCSSTKVCGWNAAKGYYACVAPPGGSDPSGANPLACGGSSSSSTSSTSSSGGGACSGEMATGDPTCDACLDNSCCTQLNTCLADQACVTCASSANPAASCNNEANFVNYANCAGGTCGVACGGGSSSSSSGSTSTSSSSSSGSAACGGQMPTGDATCDTCLDDSCCSQLDACLADQACVTCASSATPAASCNSNLNFVNYNNCAGGTCGAACGGSSGSGGGSGTGGSGSGTTGSTSSGFGVGGSGSTSSGFGVGGSGNSSSGTGTGTSVGVGVGGAGTGSSGSPGANSGCSVSTQGTGSDPAAPASLMGLLFGAAMMVSRRRR